MVLYPHARTVFEDVEEQLAIWQKLDRKDVQLSIHLCHELAHGNAERINQIIPKVASMLVLASINGAELGRNDGWDSLIMPLDKGSYDPRGYLKALVENGYKGPVVLHTYGIKDRPEDHLKRSMDRWKQMKAELEAGK
jgi:sugar phosphate isomerase/epimerase